MGERISMVAQYILTFLFLVAVGMMIISMAKSLWRPKTKLGTTTPMLLTHDFFISVMLIFSLWALLLMLMATKGLLTAQSQVIVIISAFLCPFLFWWWKKQSGSKS